MWKLEPLVPCLVTPVSLHLSGFERTRRSLQRLDSLKHSHHGIEQFPGCGVQSRAFSGGIELVDMSDADAEDFC